MMRANALIVATDRTACVCESECGTLSKNPEKLTCVSIIICDDVYRDEVTKKLVIVGTFNRINAIRFPCRQPKFVILFSITNGRGNYELTLAIEHERTGRRIAEFSGPLQIEDPLAIHDFNVSIGNIDFPEAGKYWVILSADGEPLQQRPFFVRTPTTEAE